MNLVSHIALKDLVAARIPLLVLLGGYVTLAVERQFDWRGRGMNDSPVAVFLCAIMAALGVALVASVIQEDNLVSPSAFWRTRPIPWFRLLAAKAMVLPLIFVPAFTPLLLLSGRGSIVWEMLLALCAMMLVAAVAAVTRDLRQFLWAGGAAVLLFIGSFSFVVGVVGVRSWARHWGDLTIFDGCLLMAGLLSALVTIHQFAGGDRKRSMGYLAAGLALGPALLAMTA